MKAGIVGAGIMGKLLALALQDNGWDVTLFDKNDGRTSCSMAAAGLLTPVAELEKSDPIIFKLGYESLHFLWEKIIAKLNTSIYFKKMGSLLIAHPQDKLELDQFYHVISHKTSVDQCYKIDAKKIIELEPSLTRFSDAYFLPLEGQIDNQNFLQAIQHYLLTEINTDMTNIKAYKFDMVFDCRGLGAKSIFSDLRSVRGELIWLHAPNVMITRPIRLLHPRYKLYVVPRPNQTYIIGASEIESEDHGSISVRSTLELLSAVYYIHSAFAEARIIKTVTHCRPTLSNHLPKIKYKNGLIAINGLYRHGFLIAPAIANDVIQFLLNGISSVKYPQLWESL
jgi:glycine oxidase